MPTLNRTNTYIFYMLMQIILIRNTIISINKVGPTEKDNQTFSRLVNYEQSKIIR